MHRLCLAVLLFAGTRVSRGERTTRKLSYLALKTDLSSGRDGYFHSSATLPSERRPHLRITRLLDCQNISTVWIPRGFRVPWAATTTASFEAGRTEERSWRGFGEPLESRAEQTTRTWTSVCVQNLMFKFCRMRLANSRVIACWASTGYASSACSGVEQALRECMDGPKPPPKKRNNINYHLSRFQKYVEGNSKKK